jgi:hypothetical protein
VLVLSPAKGDFNDDLQAHGLDKLRAALRPQITPAGWRAVHPRGNGQDEVTEAGLKKYAFRSAVQERSQCGTYLPFAARAPMVTSALCVCREQQPRRGLVGKPLPVN